MTRIRLGRFSCALVVVGLLGLGSGPAAAARPTAGGQAPGARWYTGQVVTRVDVTAPLIALTYDDGPREPYTSEILDVLREQGVHATFFLVGENVRRYPEVVRRIVREGHAVGNHSWSHGMLGGAAFATAYDEIARTDRAIEEATGVRTTLFRPPYGDLGPALTRAAGRLGHLQVLWSTDVADWSTRSARAVAVGTIRRMEPGSIVLLHDGGGDRGHTVTATRWMVGHLARAGFRMVTLPELLASAR